MTCCCLRGAALLRVVRDIADVLEVCSVEVSDHAAVLQCVAVHMPFKSLMAFSSLDAGYQCMAIGLAPAYNNAKYRWDDYLVFVSRECFAEDLDAVA